jgi:hypothetical protein
MCGGVALCIEGSMDVMAVAHGMIFLAAYPGILARVFVRCEVVSWIVSGICGRRDQLRRPHHIVMLKACRFCTEVVEGRAPPSSVHMRR